MDGTSKLITLILLFNIPSIVARSGVPAASLTQATACESNEPNNGPHAGILSIHAIEFPIRTRNP